MLLPTLEHSSSSSSEMKAKLDHMMVILSLDDKDGLCLEGDDIFLLEKVEYFLDKEL